MVSARVLPLSLIRPLSDERVNGSVVVICGVSAWQVSEDGSWLCDECREHVVVQRVCHGTDESVAA